MVGVVVVAHGRLADEYLAVTEMIVGRLPQLAAVATRAEDSNEVLRERLVAAVREVDSGDGVLILTDMFGGTPCNISLSLLDGERVEVLSGVNLPMLIALSTHREGKRLGELAEFLKGYGQRNINLASEILRR
ncbi:MAG TPA: PTS fructose transporter subunit IIA [Thermodesulfobacteriota bacterium]|nr:PTS fructose transporter subunit IIA [Thermodesulfobacteriota bacterium]